MEAPGGGGLVCDSRHAVRGVARPSGEMVGGARQEGARSSCGHLRSRALRPAWFPLCCFVVEGWAPVAWGCP